ncbi:hypothetical protein [Bdellovibrio sp. HCB337]|uniref:hypothetical protein n=1 Tax=Bdellovibrio sp. HCB337 TaxID=3394358 RepID=UPI0039A64C64
MILEWLEYLRTKSTKTAKDWGYVYQNISLKFRSRRCAKAWKSHNENCREFVRGHLAKTQPKSIVVVGSGLLLEVPIEALLATAEKVYLVDLVHAPEIRRLAAKHPQIELIERDISGLLGLLKKGTGPFQLKNIPWKQLPVWDLPKVDLIISANLLSQIPLMISEALPMTSETYEKFARSVRDQHIERLFGQSQKVLLFADFETRYIGHDGQRIKTEMYNVNLQDLKFDREWIWEISPFGETSKDYKIEMLVRGYYS